MAYVTRAPIAIDALIALVADPGRGGVASFLGSVRRSEEDGPVAHIEYEGYEEMIEAEGDRILAEALERWPSAAVVLRHRLGRVVTGEPSIAAVAAAPHRAEAFEACRWVVEEAKRRLPVWKREVLDDGTTAWRDNSGAKTPSR